MSQSTPAAAAAAAAASAGQGPRVVWVTRHGEREDVVEPHWYERPQSAYDDPPLADKGRVQAGELAARLRDEHIEHIVSSPFVRCVETAHIVSAARRTPLPVKVEPGICEVLWTYPAGYESAAELKRRWPLVDTCHTALVLPDRAERVDSDVNGRVALAAKGALDTCSGDILFCGHGASTSGLILALTGTVHYVGLCTLTKLVHSGGDNNRFDAEFVGDAGHLSDKSNLRAY